MRSWFAMNKRHFLSGLIFFVVSLLLAVLVLNLAIPKSNPKMTKKDFLESKVTKFSYVAVGDSLTQGVGDTTNQGGFVPLLAQELTDAYQYQVTSVNYGISGNTSSQILSRMTKQKTIQNKLAKADLMTLTVGGNDVMAVIRKNLTSLSVKSFKAPAIAYQKRLRKIINLARKDNPNLPIYVLGIYNPFYLNFPEMTKMQDIIDNWNAATETVAAEYDKVYFVPINDLLYKGIDGQEGIVQTDGEKTTVMNDALFSEDHFHPNNIGYQIMSNAVMEKIRETKSQWKD